MKIIFDDTIKEFIEYCNNNQIVVYLVGGAIRDYLRGIKTYDYDFALCSDYNEALEKLVIKYNCKGEDKYQSIKINVNGYNIEITHSRIEQDYFDYRHPNKITFIDDIKLDSLRRDFTINSIYYKDGEIYDFFNGIEDIKYNKIKFIGDINQRIKEDPLRILRMIRFSSLGFNISESDKDILNNSVDLLKKLKRDTFNSEFDKVLNLSNVELLKEYKILFEGYFDLKFPDLEKLSLLDTINEKKTYLGISNKSSLYKYRNLLLKEDKKYINELIYKLGKDIMLELVSYYDKINNSKLIDIYNLVITQGVYSKEQLNITSKEIIEIINDKSLTSYYIDLIAYSIISGDLKNEKNQIIKYILESKKWTFCIEDL